jgi:hypothetical protein
MPGNGNLFFGRLSTDPELRRLLEAFGVPKQDTLVSYAAIAEAIGGDLTFIMPRFRTIMHRWRRTLLREHNLDSLVKRGEGIAFLTESDRLQAAEGDFRRGAKIIRKASVRGGLVDRSKLDEPGALRAEKFQEAAAAVFRSATDVYKALPAPPATVSLPRPRR